MFAQAGATVAVTEGDVNNWVFRPIPSPNRNVRGTFPRALPVIAISASRSRLRLFRNESDAQRLIDLAATLRCWRPLHSV